MSDFKNNLKRTIITPAKTMMDNGEKVEGLIKESFPKNNYCTVEFIGRDGNKEIKYGIPVRRYSKGLIGWFPEKGDEVLLERIGNHYEIISQSTRNFYRENRSKNTLTKDIISDIIGDGIGGSIF